MNLKSEHTRPLQVHYYFNGQRFATKRGFYLHVVDPPGGPIGENSMAKNLGFTMEGLGFEDSLSWSMQTINPPDTNVAHYPRLMYYYHPDYLGHVEYNTDLDGLPYQHFYYTAWGETLLDQKATRPGMNFDSPYRFNGKELDDETGLYYYGARYYNPVVSVWLGVDPLAEKYPSFSPYAFVANNPVNAIDPDGKRIKPVGKSERIFLEKWASINVGDNSGISVGRNSVKINNKKFNAALEQMDPGTRQLAEAFRNVVEDKRTVNFKLGEEINAHFQKPTGNQHEMDNGLGTKILVDEMLTAVETYQTEHGVSIFSRMNEGSDWAGILINSNNHFEENGVKENKFSTFSHEIGHMSLFFEGVNLGDQRHHSIPIFFENITRLKLGEDFRIGTNHDCNH